ncbi:MAG: MarR family transcriptional regulator [candidate division NC10 bacterium]|nr:MarR family transcriptional regulator [candidate division NC10 bacterium]
MPVGMYSSHMRPLTGTLRRPLDAVFAAPSHLALLRALFEAPQGASGRELARLAGLSHQAANTALARLEGLGLVRRAGRGRTFLYTLNLEHALLTRLLRPLLDGDLQTVEVAVAPHCLSATLFGSVARGIENPASDLDLLVVLGQARERRQMARALSDLASELSRAWGIRLNPITFTEAQVRRHLREKRPRGRPICRRRGAPPRRTSRRRGRRSGRCRTACPGA